ncbi:hypothetical protein TSOC_009036, partial [Tetrabaena socialis]
FGIKPTTSTLDLDTGTAINFNPIYNPGCAGLLILEDGHIVLFGGDKASTARNMSDGRNGIAVLIVGGSNACMLGPTWSFAEVWDPLAPTTTTQAAMPPTFVAAMGNICWFANNAGSITDKNFNFIVDLPPFPVAYQTMFPFTAAVAELAYTPPNYCTRFVLFGGSTNGARTTTAATTSVRLDICTCSTGGVGGVCVGSWQVEDMLSIPRVMGDATLLPNGKVFLHGGTQKGKAGTGPNANTLANSVSLVYDPERTQGERYDRFGPSSIARAYHSGACLDITGKVLLAGCETCGKYQQLSPGMTLSPNAPLEYRLEFAVPQEIGYGSFRPGILAAPTTIAPGSVFEVSYTYSGGALVGASLMAPCASTHSLNMGQRVIMLEIITPSTATPGIVKLAAPPSDLFGKALYGHFMLFLLGQADSYSEGWWLKLAPP